MSRPYPSQPANEYCRELGRFLHSRYEDMLTCFPSSDSTPLEILMDPEALWDERAALYLTRGLLPGCEAIVKIADGLHSEKEKNLLRRMESDTEDNQRSAHGCEKPPNLYFHQVWFASEWKHVDSSRCMS